MKSGACWTNSQYTVKPRMEMLKWESDQYAEKASKCTANRQCYLFGNSNLHTLQLQSHQTLGRQICTVTGPKLEGPAVSLAMCQRTANNCDEAQIRTLQISSNTVISFIKLIYSSNFVNCSAVFMKLTQSTRIHVLWCTWTEQLFGSLRIERLSSFFHYLLC